jgi:hypothetical protein
VEQRDLLGLQLVERPLCVLEEEGGAHQVHAFARPPQTAVSREPELLQIRSAVPSGESLGRAKPGRQPTTRPTRTMRKGHRWEMRADRCRRSRTDNASARFRTLMPRRGEFWS